MAIVPEDDLEPLEPAVGTRFMGNRERLMIRLAAPALREAMEPLQLQSPPPIFLGLPPGAQKVPTPLPPVDMVGAIARQAGQSLNDKDSRTFPCGRASAFLALDAALRFLQSGAGTHAVVGGVDSYHELRVLAELDAERRLLAEDVMDGFIPGEGAGFIVLSRSAPQASAKDVFVTGVGIGQDAGHRYAKQPTLGEGLCNAINGLLASTPMNGSSIRWTLAGLNGENFGAKEWGVARVRHSSLFASTMRLNHPADCYGDLGAATGGVLFALAQIALAKGQQEGPVLLWASSDHQERGCAVFAAA
jgi:3-oxoacyl-[acyl-carrier-protein] synthase-1